MSNLKIGLNRVYEDAELMEEIQGGTRLETAAKALESVRRLDVAGLNDAAMTQQEAIILLTGRPALLIQDGQWEAPDSQTIAKRLGRPEPLREAIAKVGRVEIVDYRMDYIGTGWMIDEDLMITNRHVAELFAQRNANGFDFRSNADGRQYRVRTDFLREHERTATFQAAAKEIVLLEDASDLRPDMALIRLDNQGIQLPQPIELDSATLRFSPDGPVELAVIGYPAEDSRNDAFAMRDIFKDIYNVKRLSPGRLAGVRRDGKLLEHDCTTLGGNSGSVVLNLGTGKAAGLHFSGSYRVRNYAVTAAWIKSRLSELENRTISLGFSRASAVEAREAAPDLSGQDGYDPEFLGDSEELAIPLPTIPRAMRSKVAPVADNEEGELKYTHFSIVMRSDRRLPFFTAVNIDGEQLYAFRRAQDKWHYDPRLTDAEYQIGPELYTSNQLDRGHLVRRLDPAWGATRAEAKQAEIDTFFYTNCCPQHSQLNQRTWLSLEDHILDNAGARGLKVSVFTGPVMRERDMEYRDVLIPREFWKVVAMVNDATGALSATAYLLSQSDLLGDLEFVFGEFKTYQVPISDIEKRTGLRFELSQWDPLAMTETTSIREIRGPGDLVL